MQSAPTLLVVVLVLVLGFSGFFDYEDEDENEPSPAFSKHVLRRQAFNEPGLIRLPGVAKPIVQPVGTTLPELDSHGR